MRCRVCAALILARSAGANFTTQISILLAASASAFQPDTDAAASPSAKGEDQSGLGIDGADPKQLEGVSRHLVPLTAAQLPDVSKDLDEDRAAGIDAVIAPPGDVERAPICSVSDLGPQPDRHQ